MNGTDLLMLDILILFLIFVPPIFAIGFAIYVTIKWKKGDKIMDKQAGWNEYKDIKDTLETLLKKDYTKEMIKTVLEQIDISELKGDNRMKDVIMSKEDLISSICYNTTGMSRSSAENLAYAIDKYIDMKIYQRMSNVERKETNDN